MVKRRRSICVHTLSCHGTVLGLLIIMCIGLTQSVPKPVPDTKGTEFLFSIPLCRKEFHTLMYIVPQTTQAVNVTLVSHGNAVNYIPSGGTLRQELPCEVFEWNQVISGGIFVVTTAEVMLYIEYEDDNHVVLPFDTLSNKYIVTSLITSDMMQAFVVITGNNTNVEVLLPASLSSSIVFNGSQYIRDSKLTFTLRKYESVGITCLCDLSGATITSTLPVSVVVGSKNNESLLACVDQLPPVNVWGRKFIFPGHPWINENVTLKITGQDLYTAISITLKDSSQSASFTSIPTTSMQLLMGDFLAVETNSSILVAIMYEIIDASNRRHISFRILTPLLLYHVSSTFSTDGSTGDEISVNLILTSLSYRHILFNKTQDMNPFRRPMTYFMNFFICKAITVFSPFSVRTGDQNDVPFYGNVLRRNNNTAYDYTLGMRVTSIYDACVKTTRDHGGNGDGIDNDCDNKIDEELLDSRDNDNDDLSDEDVSYSGPIKPSPSDLAWEYYQKNKVVETGISTSVLSVIFSILAAIIAVGCFIGGMLLIEKIRKYVGASRVTPLLVEP